MAGEVGESGLGFAYARFERSRAAELVRAGGHGGDRRRLPPEESLRRAGGSAWPTSKCGTFAGTRGR
jgi:hypothetical protein